MRLVEIAGPDPKQLLQAIANWTKNSDLVASPEDMNLMKAELNNAQSPFLVKTQMFRYIFVGDDGELNHIPEAPDEHNEELKQHIMQHELAQRGLNSWSRSREGADYWFSYFEDDYYPEYTPRSVVALCEQSGVGISVEKAYEYAQQAGITDDSLIHSLRRAATEANEVIAPYYAGTLKVSAHREFGSADAWQE